MKKLKQTKIIVALLAMMACLFVILAVSNVKITASTLDGTNAQNKVNYGIAPEITVDMPEGFTDSLPHAVIDTEYAIPLATAIDVYGDELKVQRELFVHFYSETVSRIEIENNAFTPKFFGVYTITYTAKDEFGNVSTKKFDVVCEDKQEFTATLIGASDEFFVGREVKVSEVQIENAIGEVSVVVTATCDKATYELENGSFMPEYAGVYTIKYSISDYSQTKEISYTINVLENQTPIFLSEVSLPKYFIVGAQYDLPSLIAKAYSNNGIYSINPSISLRYASKNYTTKIIDGIFTPQMEGDVIITYQATAFNKTATKEYSAKVVDVNFNGEMDMTKYFYGEDFGIKAQSYGLSLSTLKDGAEVDFINSVLAKELTMGLGIDSNKNAFSKLDIYLTDSVDENVQVKISFVNDGSVAKVIVNDDDYAYASVGFNNADSLSFEYMNAGRTVSMGGSDDIVVNKTLLGEVFDGFTCEFINVKFVLGGVSDYSTIYVYSIDNQTFSNEKGDGMRPYILFSTYSEGQRKVGDVIDLERIYVADILDPNYTVTYYVTAPSGKFAISLDGELLDMDTDYKKEYSFIATENGRYVVYMEIADSVGNGETYAYAVNIVDTEGATITLSNVTTSVSAGQNIVLATATATDNRTDASGLAIYVVLVCPDWKTEMVTNGGEYKPNQYGTYTVWYYVTDSDGNVTMQSYKFTVA